MGKDLNHPVREWTPNLREAWFVVEAARLSWGVGMHRAGYAISPFLALVSKTRDAVRERRLRGEGTSLG